MNIRSFKILFLATLFTVLNATQSKEIILDTQMITQPTTTLIQKPPKPTEPAGVIILIHGTFATDTEWYQPGGDFFEVIKKAAAKKKYTVIPFAWSGQLSNTARIAASKNLAQLIVSYPSSMNIEIIAHSYGGAVATYASALLYNPIEEAISLQHQRPSAQTILEDLSQAKKETKKQLSELLEQQKTIQPGPDNEFIKALATVQKQMQAYQKQSLEAELQAITTLTQEIKDFVQAQKKLNQKTKNRITCLYTLATPVDAKQHLPNYFVIKQLKNLYSNSDIFQSVFGICQKVFLPHPQLINLKIKIGKTPTDQDPRDPTHSELHSKLLGKKLLDIFEIFKKKKIGNFEKAHFGMHGQITLFEDESTPKFEEPSF